MTLASPVLISLKEQIESVADFFKCQLNGVLGRHRGLVYSHREETDARSFVKGRKRVLDHLLTLCSFLDRSPDAVATVVHWTCMKFDVFARAKIEARYALVSGFDGMVNAAFKNRNSP